MTKALMTSAATNAATTIATHSTAERSALPWRPGAGGLVSVGAHSAATGSGSLAVPGSVAVPGSGRGSVSVGVQAGAVQPPCPGGGGGAGGEGRSSGDGASLMNGGRGYRGSSRG